MDTQKNEKTDKQILNTFRKEMQKLGFKKLSISEVKKNNKRLGLEFPKRVNDENHLQEQFVYANRNGYQVVVIPSVLQNSLLGHGRAWVHITQDAHRLWTRFFLKNVGLKNLCEKLIAYAKFAQNIVHTRPLCPKSSAFMDLYEKKDSFTYKGKLKQCFTHVWMSDHAEFSFKKYWSDYIKDLSKEELKIIAHKEFEMQRYFRERTAKHFAREIRKKTKITKIKNVI